ncbi:flavocytochrome c [Telmatospirillum siberiense]|uniref:Flavocytochrome c n=1 Tax=Telmatospirillum siberiense TaxID=382514 RepID=A0A2N3PXG3_9PROT|nr:flavocytochrome c [Telmatospirillum siberiense]PKU25094.1 flavocytochrome c [Telmatospirillum siberiense]
MSDDMKKTSRRGFLAAAGKVVAGGAAVGGLAASAVAKEAPLSCWNATSSQKWDETYDVVVIGSGFAGLAAAYEAKNAGSSVVILEKMRTPGGNSIINGGGFAAAGSPLQQAQGLTDSPELLATDMVREGLGLNHPELVKIVAEQSWPVVKWTIDEFGVQYTDHLMQEGGHSVPRTYMTPSESGADVIKAMLAKLDGIGVPVRTRVYVQKILRDGVDGRVKGLEVRTGYSFPNANSGKVVTIRARKAVVLAHGGFGQDVPFRLMQDPKLTGSMDCTNHPGATSELLREALRIGATPIQLSWIQVGPWGSPDEKGFGLGPHFAQEGAAMFGVWVNTTTGKRFISELANRKLRADIIMSFINKGQNCIAIADANLQGGVKNLLPALIERGVVRQFNTWDEIAQAYSIPADALKKTIEDYNRYLAQGKDEEFNRYLNKEAKPLGTAPLYVQRLLPKVHYTMGGVNVNALSQVTDIASDQPIPGFYAAGESVGGVHGAVRLGTVSGPTCLVFGRIAGRNAAAEKPWS